MFPASAEVGEGVALPADRVAEESVRAGEVVRRGGREALAGAGVDVAPLLGAPVRWIRSTVGTPMLMHVRSGICIFEFSLRNIFAACLLRKHGQGIVIAACQLAFFSFSIRLGFFRREDVLLKFSNHVLRMWQGGCTQFTGVHLPHAASEDVLRNVANHVLRKVSLLRMQRFRQLMINYIP